VRRTGAFRGSEGALAYLNGGARIPVHGDEETDAAALLEADVRTARRLIEERFKGE